MNGLTSKPPLAKCEKHRLTGNPGLFCIRYEESELYLVSHPAGDPKRRRPYVVVSHQGLIDSGFSTVVCAPTFTEAEGLATQVSVGTDDGLKHPSWTMCDGLVSLSKFRLTNFIGALSIAKMRALNNSLAVALDLPINFE